MFGMVLICIPCCFSFDEPRKYGKILVTTYTITGLLVLLCLVALSSDICKNAESCEIDTAGVIGILASVFWFISAGLVLLTLKWPRNADSFFSTGYPVEAVAAQPAPTIEREVRSVTNEDGSTTTVTRTTVTHPDGSKNVTETTETSEPHPIAESVPLGSDAVPLAASMPAPEETTPTASVLSVVQEPVAATKAAP
jgi:cytoskeletal protein RodZ